MGSLKDWHMEMTAGGMDLRGVISKTVCASCVQDQALTEWVSRNATEDACSYCDEAGPRARVVPMTDLVRFVNSALEREYEDAEGALGLDDEAENGFFGDTDTTDDLLERELDLVDSDAPFARDLTRALGDRTWCKLDPYGPAGHELLTWSWRDFRETVLHDRRYFFREAADRRRRSNDETPSAEALLAGLLGYCRRGKLFRTLPTGTRYYRCQRINRGDTTPFDAGRMGPPPPHLAFQSNRMSPAGISMFYGSEDRTTALVETLDKRRRAAVGSFETLRPINLLDLSERPFTPSVFEEGAAGDRAWAKFLREFMADFVQPISRDGAEHVEYAPTQIVAEYIRVFGRHRTQAVDGIIYASARRRGKTSVVLFAGNDDVEGPHRNARAPGVPWLRMVDYHQCVFDPTPHVAPSRPVFLDSLAAPIA